MKKLDSVRTIAFVAAGVILAGYILNKAGNTPILSDARNGLGGI